MPWLLAFLAVFLMGYLVADFSLLLGLSWAGSDLDSPRWNLVVGLAAIGIAFGPGVLWALNVPVPATRLGVSPQGVVIDYGLRSAFWPWRRAFLRGNRLDMVSERYGVASRFALTPYQASRVAFLRPPVP
jgi:hypothetical protein